MPGIKLLHKIENDSAFALTCDLVVFCNLVYIGFEVDFGDIQAWSEVFFYIRLGFLIWCAVEFAIRIGGAGKDFINLRNTFEVIFVACAAVDVIVFTKPGWLWRLSGLRSWRMLRVYQYARTSPRLKELSLVLDALLRSWKALAYLAAVMAGAYWSAGAWARGILKVGGAFDDDGMDPDMVEEYWGQSIKAAFTMFQLSTNDGWAGSVIRPIMDKDLFAGGCLLLYTWMTSYTLLSLGIGVMVWATVEEARSSGDHTAHMQMVEDREIMRELRRYFEASLELQDRHYIDYLELRDAFSVPEVVSAIKHLELPLQDAESLFAHVDVLETGSITVDELMSAVKTLSEKATPFDTCCLTARIGGTATFTTRLVTRTDEVTEQLQDIGYKMAIGIEALTTAASENEELTQVPEVLLRKAGLINHHKELNLSRYSA